MILGLSFPVKTQALTQYAHINATGAALLGGKVVISAADGLHILDNQQGDNDNQITAWFKTIKTDFGYHNRKKIRSVYVRGLMAKLVVSLITKDETFDNDLVSSTGELAQEEGYVQGKRSQVAAYWQLQIKNKEGEDFSIDAVDISTVSLSAKIGRRPAIFKSHEA